MLPDELRTELMQILIKIPFEEFMIIEKCIKLLETKNKDLEDQNFELCKRILVTNDFIKKIQKVSDYLNGIPCEDVLKLLNSQN